MELRHDDNGSKTGRPSAGRLQRLVAMAERFGLARALRSLHDQRNPSVTLLAYHRVMPVDILGSYPFDPQLISATPAQFEWQMAYIRRHLNPVSLADISAFLEGTAALPPRAIAVTFDDGFGDTYRYAFPILKRHSIPATVFLSTHYVDSGEPFWFELVSFLVLNLEPGSLAIDEMDLRIPDGPSPIERVRSLRRLHGILKELPNERRVALVSQWAHRFSSKIQQGATGLGRPITWTQVREMAAASIAFGSHSVTHPNLTQLDDADLDWELNESKRMISEQLQRDVSSIAYPIGTRSAFDERVIAAARRAGYRIGLTYIPGANSLASMDPFAIRRHGLGLETTEHYFRALTSLPSWLR